MVEEFPIKENDNERIINDFRSIRFPCIRCGYKDLKMIGAEAHAYGTNVHGLHQTSNPNNDSEMTFYVTSILTCRRCNHRFHVKILDQGIRNTNIYFDNTLAK